MKASVSDTQASRRGVTVICFLLVICGELWLLRNLLLEGNLSSLSPVCWLELLFLLLLAAGTVFCLIRPQGWGGKVGCTTALLLFTVYAAFSVWNYSFFLQAYLTGFHPAYESSAGGLIGLKLVLVLIGITAAIPTTPRIDDREYARLLREQAQRQEASWARASVEGARKDLNATLEKLKATLSEEEIAALIKQSENTAAHSASDPTPDPEEWHGWGGGM